MMQLALWPLLAVWMGIALIVGVSLIGTIVWCTAHLAKDVLVGEKGTIWCPAMKRDLRVTGTPSYSTRRLPFLALRQCERFGSQRIGCKKSCLLTAAGVPAA